MKTGDVRLLPGMLLLLGRDHVTFPTAEEAARLGCTFIETGCGLFMHGSMALIVAVKPFPPPPPSHRQRSSEARLCVLCDSKLGWIIVSDAVSHVDGLVEAW